jgi:hypothetical protein
LASPREVRNALLYVLANFRKHATRPARAGLDPYSSAAWFDGWREWSPATGMPPPWTETDRGDWMGCVDDDPKNLRPRTWLAALGWRRHGRLGIAEAPKG